MRTRPVLLFDGDCGFCTSCVRFAERRIAPDADLRPFQFEDLGSYGTTWERAEHEVVWITPDGRASGGVQGIAALLRHRGGLFGPVGVLLRLPPFRWIAHGLYRLVANNRHRMPGGTAACALPAHLRPGARRPAEPTGPV
ncbi:DUF393 domain-containing protein [Actinocorallia longicatena]|uniref:DCC family thiol-disulfide oxidoreductase YuxK n=1 Tax=Actinocorallia longicatena TaxID=111803 RepID=A0ABP6Q928_9ACTN